MDRRCSRAAGVKIQLPPFEEREGLLRRLFTLGMSAAFGQSPIVRTRGTLLIIDLLIHADEEAKVHGDADGLLEGFAQALGVKPKTVRRYLDVLSARGWTRTQRDDGGIVTIDIGGLVRALDPQVLPIQGARGSQPTS